MATMRFCPQCGGRDFSEPGHSIPQPEARSGAPHVPPAAPLAPAAVTSFSDPAELTKWLKYLLYASIVGAAIAILSNFSQHQLLSDFALGSNASEASFTAAADSNDNRQSMIATVQLVIWVITIVLFAKWIYRANFNSRALGARNMKYSPGMAVGWYCIPLFNLWRPYQAMKEIWKTSKNPAGWESEEVDSILPWWWFFFLISSALGNASFKYASSATEIPDLISATKLLIASDIVQIVSCLTALVLVGKIYEMQMAHVPRRT
jgi:hypothetical protein